MQGREIKAKEVIIDIRAGMDDAAIMEKYKLSPLGLHNLLVELNRLGLLEPAEEPHPVPGRHRIKIREVVQDISSGMSDAQLMRKYSLSSNALQVLFKKLLDLKAISRDTLFGEVGLQYDTSVPENVRGLHRYFLDFDVPVYEMGFPDAQGRIRDITEKGVGLIGLVTEVGQPKTLVVLGDSFGVIEPFEFDAVCRWARQEEPDGVLASGFQITSIFDKDMEELRKLISLISFGY